MLTSEQMSKLVQKIGPWAVDWVRNKIQNLDEKSRETQAKQLLRCKFMLLNQFGEGERSKKWQNDLQHVGGEIIRQLCPNWETDLEDRKIFLVIEKAVHNAVFMKRSPRQEWFKPVVYQWLKEGEAKRVAAKTHNIAWYPQHAIQVAHHIFLTKGDEEALVHYFRHKSRYKGEIKKVVDARKKDEDPKDDYRSRLSPEQQKFEAELRALEQRIQQREERVKQREMRLNEREYQVKDREMELKAKENRSRKLEHQLRVWEQKLKVREQRLKKMHTR